MCCSVLLWLTYRKCYFIEFTSRNASENCSSLQITCSQHICIILNSFLGRLKPLKWYPILQWKRSDPNRRMGTSDWTSLAISPKGAMEKPWPDMVCIDLVGYKIRLKKPYQSSKWSSHYKEIKLNFRQAFTVQFLKRPLSKSGSLPFFFVES
jgi:hypothetical protein